jgi:hypothetical protein
VVRLYPFVIRLKHHPIEAGRQAVALKIDPGARTSGMAIVGVALARLRGFAAQKIIFVT